MAAQELGFTKREESLEFQYVEDVIRMSLKDAELAQWYDLCQFLIAVDSQ